jgi:hypothetical protein
MILILAAGTLFAAVVIKNRNGFQGKKPDVVSRNVVLMGVSLQEGPMTEAIEIEVIGGYDEPFDVDLPRRPLPSTVERLVRGFTNREQLFAYLRRLPDDCLNVHRHIQWRLLENDSLGQTSGCAYIHRPLPEWRSLAEADVRPFKTGQRVSEPGVEADGGGM